MPVPKEPWLSKVRRRQRKILDFAVRRYAASELESRAEEFVRIFAGDLVPGSRILDIGGGWGSITLLSVLGDTATGFWTY